MRGKYGVSDDPYCWPGTSVLRNKLDIRDKATLAHAEAEFAAAAVEYIDITAPPFDLDYLCRLHRQLFLDLYEWAGTIRTVDIAKGTTRFCTASRIAPEADSVMRTLGQMDLANATRPKMLHHIAECYGELNLVHPFREGNGRTQRLFFEYLLVVNGYGIDWGEVEQDEWTGACILAVDGDYAPLASIFDRCITRIGPQAP